MTMIDQPETTTEEIVALLDPVWVPTPGVIYVEQEKHDLVTRKYEDLLKYSQTLAEAVENQLNDGSDVVEDDSWNEFMEYVPTPFKEFDWRYPALNVITGRGKDYTITVEVRRVENGTWTFEVEGWVGDPANADLDDLLEHAGINLEDAADRYSDVEWELDEVTGESFESEES